MEDMRIELKDARKAEENEKGAGPLVMVPLYWLESLIRDSEKYWNTVTDADVLGMVKDLQKSVKALYGQVDVQHYAIVELKRSIEGDSEEDAALCKRQFVNMADVADVEKSSNTDGKASKNPEKVTSEPEKCTETSKKRPKATKKDPEEAGKKKIDDGKIRALYEGGWKVKDIADEMHLSDQTIYNHLKAMGLMQ